LWATHFGRAARSKELLGFSYTPYKNPNTSANMPPNTFKVRMEAKACVHKKKRGTEGVYTGRSMK
jgi:hypothetical protein